MNLPWHTRVRVAVIRAIAKLLKVPLLIDYGMMPEYKLAEIIAYIEKCEQLFGPIFDIEKLHEFRIWALQMLTHPRSMDIEVHISEHPLEFTAVFFGMTYNPFNDEANREMDDLYKRYRETGLKLAWHDQ